MKYMSLLQYNTKKTAVVIGMFINMELVAGYVVVSSAVITVSKFHILGLFVLEQYNIAALKS